MTLTLRVPQKMMISNTSDIDLMFRPYRENFDVSVPAGQIFEFTCTTAGQCLYYMQQGITLPNGNGLYVDPIDEFDMDENVTIIPSPANIVIANESTRKIGFIPYREHFEYVLEPGDAVILETKTLGQCLYYMAQATKGLVVYPEQDATN